MRESSPRPIERGLVARLAAADLRHEWILSLCVILALAAVLAPLLLMFGLKFGTIETLRRRLIQDPSNCEIRPLATVARDLAWFDQMRARPDVGFLTPTTRQIAAGVIIKSLSGTEHIDCDLIPTDEGDRLVVENGSRVPGPGEVVITAMAARMLNVKEGDSVSVTATRSSGVDSERATVEMRVAGTLGMRASGLKAVYATLSFLESVESYKDGMAVPDLGWPGSLPLARPVFDGAIVLLPMALSEERKLRLITSTGLNHIDQLDGDGLQGRAGWSAKNALVVYLLSNEASTVGEESLIAIRDQLRGESAEVLAWIRPLNATLRDATGYERPILVQALSIAPDKAAAFGIEPAPPWGAGTELRLDLLMPDDASTGEATLTTVQAEHPLKIPVTIKSHNTASAGALVPTALGGLLRLSQERRLRFDEHSRHFLLERRNYAGFRMYARTLDDVEPLRSALAAEGINVHTEAQRISEVTELDRHLTRIFWIIAVVGISGGVAALVASLYASVERKRREFGVLRLVGISRQSLMRFPVYQSLILAGMSFLFAATLFHTIAMTINHLFREQLRAGESFCRLPIIYQSASLATVLAFATIAAALAAARVNRAAPADALREE
ncbi:MAG: ABC transporter permease [Verrucomicrobiota bacterium]